MKHICRLNIFCSFEPRHRHSLQISTDVSCDLSIWGSNSVWKLNIKGFVWNLVLICPTAKMPGRLAKHPGAGIDAATSIQQPPCLYWYLLYSCSQIAFVGLVLPFGWISRENVNERSQKSSLFISRGNPLPFPAPCLEPGRALQPWGLRVRKRRNSPMSAPWKRVFWAQIPCLELPKFAATLKCPSAPSIHYAGT